VASAAGVNAYPLAKPEPEVSVILRPTQPQFSVILRPTQSEHCDYAQHRLRIQTEHPP